MRAIEAQTEGAKRPRLRPRIEGEALIEGLKRPRIEGKARIGARSALEFGAKPEPRAKPEIEKWEGPGRGLGEPLPINF